MTAVVPRLLFDLGWSYKNRPANPYRSPSGTYTIGDRRLGVPFRNDREIVLYLAYLAFLSYTSGRATRRIRGNLRDLCAWLGANRRRRDTRKRLERVLASRILLRTQTGDHKEIQFGVLQWLDHNEFIVTLGEEFFRQSVQGIPYSLDVARRLRRFPAALELYLALICFVATIIEYKDLTHRFEPYARLPHADRRGKVRQTLARHIERLRGSHPEAYFSLDRTGLAVLVDIGKPKRDFYSVGKTSQSIQRDRIEDALYKQTPAERRRLGHMLQRFADMEAYARRPSKADEIRAQIREYEQKTARAFDSVRQYTAKMRTAASRFLGRKSKKNHD